MGVDLIVLQQLAVAFGSMAPALAAILAVSIIIAATMFLWQPSRDTEMPEQKNPPRLKRRLFLLQFTPSCCLLLPPRRSILAPRGFTPWRSSPDSLTWTRLRFRRPAWLKVAAPVPPQAGTRS
jgi:hypothetical protein